LSEIKIRRKKYIKRFETSVGRCPRNKHKIHGIATIEISLSDIRFEKAKLYFFITLAITRVSAFFEFEKRVKERNLQVRLLT